MSSPTPSRHQPDPVPQVPYRFIYKVGPGGTKMVSGEERQTMVQLYKEGQTCHEVAAALGRTGRSVLNHLIKAGVARRDSSQCMKQRSVKEDYFRVIDTPTKAYLLGMIYADGNVYRNRFKLSLWEVDEPFLKAVAVELGFDGKLYRYPKRGPKRKDMLALTIYGRAFVQHLRDKGVVDNKTNKLTFPTFLAPELVIHFIHGLLDGDGCITSSPPRREAVSRTHSVGFAGCYVLMEGVHKWFATHGVTGSIRHNNANPLSGTVMFSGTKALAVANMLYNHDQPLFLARKQDRYRAMVRDMNDTRLHRHLRTRALIDDGLIILNQLPHAA